VCVLVNLSQKLRPYGAIKYVYYYYYYYYYYCFLTPVLNSQGMKIKLCNTKKYKNQAGMNFTPPPPSQNSHAIRWHYAAESERRVAEIITIIIL